MQNDSFCKKELPDKLYFRIGEVGAIAKLPTYVLRFWETEFSGVKPKRTASGQRLYRKSDVELILKIKHLLYDKKFTIKGAKQHLSSRASERKSKSLTSMFNEICSELESIRDFLER